MKTKQNIVKLKTNPKIRVFLVILLLSTIYWFFTSLSEKHLYVTYYKINYTNIPENLLLQKQPTKRIQAQIEASGFEIISHKLKLKSLTFDVSKFKPSKKYKYFYLPNNQILTIQKQIKDARLIQFSTDSILIYLGHLKTKKVPVNSEVQLSFKPGYKLTESIMIKPDSIEIKGPEKYIDSIKSIKTIQKELSDINQNFIFDVSLDTAYKNISELSFNTSHVELIGNVSKFTEGEMEVKIKLPKIPKGVQMELFPKIATIKYEVAFDKYQKIDSGSFSLTCDYPTEPLTNQKTLELYLSEKPDFIKDYTIEPRHVTFLIQHTNSN